MHERVHEQPAKTDTTGATYENLPGDADEPKKQTRAEAIREISEPMRRYALSNPCLDAGDIDALVLSGRFSRFLQTQNISGIHVLLTVSPSDAGAPPLFWHCSMSLVSIGSGRPKTFILWTARERRNVRDLLTGFLGESGVPKTDSFMRTKTALHITRGLTAEEYGQILVQSEEGK